LWECFLTFSTHCPRHRKLFIEKMACHRSGLLCGCGDREMSLTQTYDFRGRYPPITSARKPSSRDVGTPTSTTFSIPNVSCKALMAGKSTCQSGKSPISVFLRGLHQTPLSWLIAAHITHRRRCYCSRRRHPQSQALFAVADVTRSRRRHPQAHASMMRHAPAATTTACLVLLACLGHHAHAQVDEAALERAQVLLSKLPSLPPPPPHLPPSFLPFAAIIAYFFRPLSPFLPSRTSRPLFLCLPPVFFSPPPFCLLRVPPILEYPPPSSSIYHDIILTATHVR